MSSFQSVPRLRKTFMAITSDFNSFHRVFSCNLSPALSLEDDVLDTMGNRTSHSMHRKEVPVGLRGAVSVQSLPATSKHNFMTLVIHGRTQDKCCQYVCLYFHFLSVFLDTDILLLLICFSFQVYMHLEYFKCLINETKCILIPIKSSKTIAAKVSSVLLQSVLLICNESLKIKPL